DSVERSWKEIKSGKVITYTETYEGIADLTKFLIEIEKPGVKEYLANKDNAILTSTKLSYKEKNEAGQIKTVVETYELGLDFPTAIQKTYYDRRDTQFGGRDRVVKVTENIVKLTKDGEEFTQSEQYVYRMKDTVILEPETNKTGERSATVIETYEGNFESGNIVCSQVQKDYSIITNGVLKHVSAYYDPGLSDAPISIQFKYKELNNAAQLITIIDTYESGVQSSRQVVYKVIEDKNNPVSGKLQGARVVTRVENWESGLLINIQDTWKNIEKLGNKETIVTYSLTHILGWTDIDLVIEKSYYIADNTLGLVNIIETYEFGIKDAPTSIKRIYRSEKSAPEITATGARSVTVIEVYEYNLRGSTETMPAGMANMSSQQYLYW
ncbi:MAG: hypothetical protein AAB267_00295, partial [Candidatus Desantisbacteria bacterium]